MPPGKNGTGTGQKYRRAVRAGLAGLMVLRKEYRPWHPLCRAHSHRPKSNRPIPEHVYWIILVGEWRHPDAVMLKRAAHIQSDLHGVRGVAVNADRVDRRVEPRAGNSLDRAFRDHT